MNPELPEASEQDEDTKNLWNVLYRRQQLQNRLQFLQEIQKKNRIEECHANEDGPSELDRIEEELKELEQKEKDLIQKRSQCLTTVSTDKDPIQAPIQGLYVLPISPAEPINPAIILPEPILLKTTTETTPINSLQEEKTGSTVPLDEITMSPAKVKCPSCHKIVTTEIQYKLSSNAFLFCCLLSVVGCVAGCCLVPFCLNRFKDVAHSCPSCNKEICAVNRI
ncbi:uncharacterized protein isoform X1 [Danio rerio]|uniref:Uncharacterized protein isoform X1 n=1 Tax=Danio rerio TaxID=7955 RepID=A0AB32U1L8_DANRE